MIIVGGEALIDLVAQPGSINTAAKQTEETPTSFYQGTVGGGPLNAAVTAARLGAEVYFYGCLSQDVHGKAIRSALHASQVSTDFTQKSSSPTMLAFASLDEDKKASYNFYLTGISDNDVHYDPLWCQYAAIVVTGGLGFVLENAWKVYAQLNKNALELGKITIIDPNIRPAALKDSKKYKQRLATVFSTAVIIKLSDEDLTWIINSSQSDDHKAWCANIFADNPSLQVILITYGEKGISLVTRNFSFTEEVPQAEVVDTIGAGDSITGALACWFSTHGIVSQDQVRDISQETWKEIIQWCASIAAITVTRAGANPPWLAEIS